MTEKALFLKLLDYNEQATGRILDEAAKLTSEQFRAPTGQSHGSLQMLLIHALRTEWVWRRLSSVGHRSEMPPFTEERYPDVGALREAWTDENAQMRAYLESLSEEQLDAARPVTDRHGNVMPMIPWQMLVQRFMHSMQHRTEAAAILTGYGHSPGDLDFIFFI